MRYLLVSIVLFSCSLSAEDFTGFPRAQEVIEILVEEHGYDRVQVEAWMASGRYREEPVKTIAAPAEKTRTYAQYRPMFLARDTIVGGKKFLLENQTLLNKAEELYGVPAEIIVAIIGIESRYGRSTGRHNTFDSLGSLAVTEGRRADYFRREWIRFLLIMREQGIDPLKVKGSYAGATGYPQFMPTSYQAYAVDHDGDGDIDIWQDQHDAIGSVANYLRENGWQPGQPIISAVTLSGDFESVKLNSFSRDRTFNEVSSSGWQSDIQVDEDDFVFPIRLDEENGPEYWLGFRNFWAISRYNRSISYTMAVTQLADAIVKEDE